MLKGTTCTSNYLIKITCNLRESNTFRKLGHISQSKLLLRTCTCTCMVSKGLVTIM